VPRLADQKTHLDKIADERQDLGTLSGVIGRQRSLAMSSEVDEVLPSLCVGAKVDELSDQQLDPAARSQHAEGCLIIATHDRESGPHTLKVEKGQRGRETSRLRLSLSKTAH
jgi:hypothetical protein